MGMDHFVTTGGFTYRIPSDAGEVDEVIGWLADSRAAARPVVMLSRQQIATRTGKTVLPGDFPQPDVVVGDPNRDGGFTRGWLEVTVEEWLSKQAPGPEPETQESDTAEAETPEAAHIWAKKSVRWDDVPTTAADGQIVIATSMGVAVPSGKAISGPIPSGADLARFVRWHWPGRTRELPQVWVTAETLEAIGFPLEAVDEQIPGLVAQYFECKVGWHQSGWFTCEYPASSAGERARLHLVLVPFMMLDPSPSRPDDMGIARIETDASELPDDETAAAHLLSARMAWLASLGDGLLPAPRWATVGVRLFDAVRKRARKLDPPIEPCPQPPEIAGGLVVDPPMTKWRNLPHRSKAGTIEVEVDQRRAFLASAGQVWLGYGTPFRVAHPEVLVFNEQRPPFGVWHVNLPAGKDLDGLSKRLPLPQEHMDWDEPASLWITTRGVQHLTAPVEFGGGGLAPAELDIDAALLWPEQSRLLKTWTEVLRAADKQAIAEGRVDRSAMVKAIYSSYIGKTEAAKIANTMRVHQQWAFAPAIRADVRWRAMRYAARIVTEHDVYPVDVDADAWTYRLPEGTDPAFLEEKSTDNGRYRIKNIETY
jgi:hypothetical protein